MVLKVYLFLKGREVGGGMMYITFVWTKNQKEKTKYKFSRITDFARVYSPDFKLGSGETFLWIFLQTIFEHVDWLDLWWITSKTKFGEGTE